MPFTVSLEKYASFLRAYTYNYYYMTNILQAYKFYFLKVR